jgi:hypothetical protein
MFKLQILPAIVLAVMATASIASARSASRGSTVKMHTIAATTHRSSSARRAFQRSHPCPSTGGTSGACRGYVVDHIVPLKRGGADTPSNMQWQTVEAAKAKDKIE